MDVNLHTISQAKNIKIGDPLLDETQMGPLCTREQLKHIENELDFAVSEGATILTGGRSPENLSDLFFEPTIVSCPNQNLKISFFNKFSEEVLSLKLFIV